MTRSLERVAFAALMLALIACQVNAARQVLQAPAEAPAAAPASAPDTAEVPAGSPDPAPTQISTRANLIDDFESAAQAVDEMFGGHVWGNWCGKDSDNNADPIDDLDQACKEHDLCLEDPAYEVAGVSSDEACLASKFMGLPNCYCDSELAHKAWEIYNNGKKDCSWWNIFCWEEDRVKAAQRVALSQDLRQFCGGC